MKKTSKVQTSLIVLCAVTGGKGYCQTNDAPPAVPPSAPPAVQAHADSGQEIQVSGDYFNFNEHVDKSYLGVSYAKGTIKGDLAGGTVTYFFNPNVALDFSYRGGNLDGTIQNGQYNEYDKNKASTYDLRVKLYGASEGWANNFFLTLGGAYEKWDNSLSLQGAPAGVTFNANGLRTLSYVQDDYNFTMSLGWGIPIINHKFANDSAFVLGPRLEGTLGIGYGTQKYDSTVKNNPNEDRLVLDAGIIATIYAHYRYHDWTFFGEGGYQYLYSDNIQFSNDTSSNGSTIENNETYSFYGFYARVGAAFAF
jgi:hypothetical protein